MDSPCLPAGLMKDRHVGNSDPPQHAFHFWVRKFAESLLGGWHEDKWAQSGHDEWRIMAIFLPQNDPPSFPLQSGHSFKAPAAVDESFVALLCLPSAIVGWSAVSF